MIEWDAARIAASAGARLVRAGSDVADVRVGAGDEVSGAPARDCAEIAGVPVRERNELAGAAVSEGEREGGLGPRRVTIDSRRVQPGDLFVGLPGERVDGGAYAEQALRAGAWGVLVAPAYAATASAATDATAGAVLAHPDPLAGLQTLARAWRRALGTKVVGITGSTGKTSTKDILAALLASDRSEIGQHTAASPENLNTEIGLPLAVLAAPHGTEALVLEMAMRGPGQIAELVAIAEPDVGVIVNVGPVHLELLGSLEAIAAAKAELIAGLAPGATVVIPAGEPLLAPHLRADLRTVTFGQGGDVELLRGAPEGQGGDVELLRGAPEGQGGDVELLRGAPEGQGGDVELLRGAPEGQGGDVELLRGAPEGQGGDVQLLRGAPEGESGDAEPASGHAKVEDAEAESAPRRADGEVVIVDHASAGDAERIIVVKPSFSQSHNLRNLLAAVAAARVLGVTPGGRLDVAFSALRGEHIALADGIVLINDCYNANPMSMRAALDDLAATAPARRVAVLGDMLELGGEQGPGLHREVGAYARARGVQLLVAVGPQATEIGQGFGGEVRRAPDAAAAAALLPELLRRQDTVLVKGSRGVGLELVAETLTAAAGSTAAASSMAPGASLAAERDRLRETH